MYTFMMASVLLLSLFFQGGKYNRRKFIWISCFLMFAVMGLRDVNSIGIDSASSYIRIYRECGEASWGAILAGLGEENNLGYTIINKIIFKITNGNYQAYLIIYSAFVMIVFGRFIQRYSANPIESFAYFWGLICYAFLCDSLKQGIAMAFITLAFDAIIERKLPKYLLFVTLAVFVHAPALIFLPAYWIASMKVGRGYLYTLAGMLIFTYLFRDSILDLMLRYYGTEMQMHDMRFLANKVLIMLVIVVAAMVLRPPREKGDRLYNILLQFMGISIVIQTFASYNNTFERLANYYFQFAVIFIPLVFQKGKRRSLVLSPQMEAIAKTWAPFLFGGFGVWRYANYIQSNDWIWLPFRFFFQK